MIKPAEAFEDSNQLLKSIDFPRTSFEYYLSIGLTKYHIQKGIKSAIPLAPNVFEGLMLVNPTKYNLGCKDFTMSLNNGWLNIELFHNHTKQNEFLRSRSIDEEDRSIFLNCDLLNGVPALDDSLHFVYHSLLLDCFEYVQALTLLDRIHAALKTGGKHRISVLDGHAIAMAYLHKDPDLYAIEDQIFNSKFDAYNSGIFEPPREPDFQNLLWLWHQSFWDAESLSMALAAAGLRIFRKVRAQIRPRKIFEELS